jgi:hypothetical protein
MSRPPQGGGNRLKAQAAAVHWSLLPWNTAGRRALYEVPVTGGAPAKGKIQAEGGVHGWPCSATQT